MSTSNLIKVSKYLLVNSIFSASLYYGYVEHVEGAERIALAIAWFCIVISWFANTEQAIKVIQENPSLIPAWLDRSFDFIVTAAFFWFGSVWTASFYLLHILLILAAKEKAMEPANNEKE
jgi:hypothetical protein